MDDLILAIIVLGVVGVLAALISNFLNSDVRKLELEAEGIVRDRIAARDDKPLSDLTDYCASKGLDNQKAQYLLGQLSAVVGGNSSDIKFTQTDILSDLFRVQKSELLDFDRAWKKAGLGNYIEVFSTDIVNLLDGLIGKEDAARLLKELEIENADEDQVKDMIMDMNIGSFLETFLPYVKK